MLYFLGKRGELYGIRYKDGVCVRRAFALAQLVEILMASPLARVWMVPVAIYVLRYF